MFKLIVIFSLMLYAYVCKHRKAWNPSLHGMNSNRFTLGLGDKGHVDVKEAPSVVSLPSKRA